MTSEQLKSSQSIFVIAGMHRSGTSLTSALFQSMKVDIGDRLMVATQANKKGYFEDLDFVEFHQSVFHSQGFSQDGWILQPKIQVQAQYLETAKLLVQKRADKPLWGWKDPRTTLFMDFWADLIPQSCFILVYRSPWEVVDSLYRRNDEIFHQNPNLAIKVWECYNRAVIDFHESFPERSILLNIDAIKRHPNLLQEIILKKTGIRLESPDRNIYEPSLLDTRISSTHKPALIEQHFPEVLDLYNRLNAKQSLKADYSELSPHDIALKSNGQEWVLQDWLDSRRANADLKCSQLELQQAQNDIDRSKSQLQQAQNDIDRSRSQLQQSQNELDRWQSQLQKSQNELDEIRSQLQRTKMQLKQSETSLGAIQTSKFWQLRSRWFDLRHAIGILDDDRSLFKGYPFAQKLGDNLKVASVLENINHSVEVLSEIPQSNDINYQKWLNKNYPTKATLSKMTEVAQIFGYKPTISLVMPVYNPPERYLREAIESVLNQVYPYWELCIADDASPNPRIKEILSEYSELDSRIKVVFRKENGHISNCSNSALEIASGEFIALLDHDDLLAPHALYEVALLLNKHSKADMIYSDEDKVDDAGKLDGPYFKPDWCPDSFLSRMYTCHLGVYRRELVDRIGGFRVGYEGSQDYDLVLRLTEKTENIFHIPNILYHWRVHPESTASGGDAKQYAYVAAEKALLDALERRKEPGKIARIGTLGHYQVRYHLNEYPLVSIIIPTRDLSEVLDNCLTSIFEKTTYPNYEVVLIDNNSQEESTKKVLLKWTEKEASRFFVYRLDIPFNYSKINNYGVERARGDYLLFLNNDTEVITSEWLNAMVEQAQRDSIGAVGALLLYPDNTIQHAGVLLGIGGIAGHAHKYHSSDSYGYSGGILTITNYSAVTGACLMCRREVFQAVGGFEEKLEIALNDVDLCLKILEKGYRNIYLPHVKLYHYESKSRGYEDTPAKKARFQKEKDYVIGKWQELIDCDPCYNPNLTRNAEDFAIDV
jgi:O-antigen biosynthesis protein